VTLRAAKLAEPIRVPAGFSGSGAVVVIPGEVWLATGGFDQDYFLFEEDRSFGRRLEELGIPAYLCGDCVVMHDGGFRSRDLSVAAAFEGLISEQISWRKHAVGPGFILLLLQVIGLSLRWTAAVGLGRWQNAKVYHGVLLMLVRSKGQGSADLYGEDGLRVPAAHRYLDCRDTRRSGA